MSVCDLRVTSLLDFGGVGRLKIDLKIGRLKIEDCLRLKWRIDCVVLNLASERILRHD